MSEKRSKFVILLTILVAVGAFVFTYLYSADEDYTEETSDHLSMVIAPTNEALQTLAYSLQDKLRTRFDVTVIPQTLLETPIVSSDLAEHYQADMVLTLQGTSVGRHIGVEFLLYSEGEVRPLWSNAFTEAEYLQYAHEIARQSLAPVLQWIEHKKITIEYPSSDALVLYLRGRNALDHNTGMFYIERAKNYFYNALLKHGDFALAYAGQCEALIYESWIEYDKEALDDANKMCGTALALNNAHPYVQSAKGSLLRRVGKLENAREHYESLLILWPDNAELLIGLGNVEFSMYVRGENGRKNLLSSAEEHLLKAGFSDPEYWRSFFYLGSIQFSAGKISKAIRAIEQAISEFPNEMAMVNLGTMYFCKGENTKSRDIFLTARKIAPESHLGHKYMAEVYYYMEDYKTAATLQEDVLKVMHEKDNITHQMWGSLAESERHLGLDEKAIEHYKRAIKMVEDKFSGGNAYVKDKVYHAYYYRILHELSPSKYSAEILPYSQEELSSFAKERLDSGAYIKLAQIFMLDKRQDSARDSLSRAAEKCPVYASQPDLKALGGMAFMP